MKTLCTTSILPVTTSCAKCWNTYVGRCARRTPCLQYILYGTTTLLLYCTVYYNIYNILLIINITGMYCNRIRQKPGWRMSYRPSSLVLCRRSRLFGEGEQYCTVRIQYGTLPRKRRLGQRGEINRVSSARSPYIGALPFASFEYSSTVVDPDDLAAAE